MDATKFTKHDGVDSGRSADDIHQIQKKYVIHHPHKIRVWIRPLNKLTQMGGVAKRALFVSKVEPL